MRRSLLETAPSFVTPRDVELKNYQSALFFLSIPVAGNSNQLSRYGKAPIKVRSA